MIIVVKLIFRGLWTQTLPLPSKQQPDQKIATSALDFEGNLGVAGQRHKTSMPKWDKKRRKDVNHCRSNARTLCSSGLNEEQSQKVLWAKRPEWDPNNPPIFLPGGIHITKKDSTKNLMT